MSRQKQANQIRIIGGHHRGRKLSFPDAPGLRPTGDRIRETLFNWIVSDIAQARCLDAFAGSGSLGFEAASRGAGRVVMLERERKVCGRLNENARLLDLEQVQVQQVDTLTWLGQAATETFDLVFLDPPFADGLLEQCCEGLLNGGWLAPKARVYIEYPVSELPKLPEAWHIEKQKKAGQVGYAIIWVD